MQTGRLEANLNRLNEIFNLPYLPELIECKVTGAERLVLPEIDLEFHQKEFERLCLELKEANQKTHLPNAPSCKDELNELLVRIRLQFI